MIKPRANKFLKRFFFFLPSKDFLKSSSIVSTANLTTAFIGQILIIIVSRKLDSLADWTALKSVIMILGIIILGVSNQFSKRTSEIAKKSKSEAIQYYKDMKSGLKKTYYFAIIGVAATAIITHLFFQNVSFIITTLVAINFALQIHTRLKTFFLMGFLSVKSFAKNTLITESGRFIITVFFLQIGLEIISLPLGMILSTVISYIHAEKCIKNEDEKLINKARKESKYTLNKELPKIFATVFFFFVLNSFFLIPPILSPNILNTNDADAFAVLFTLGQIIHLVSVAFFALVLTYSARNKNKKIYFFSMSLTIIITILSGLVLQLLSGIILKVFDKPGIFESNIIIIYSIMLIFFNTLFVSTRYLIGSGNYKTLQPLIFFLLILFVSLINFDSIKISNNSLLNYIILNIVITGGASIYINGAIILNPRKYLTENKV